MLVVFLAMQLVPYGWRHPNPPVRTEAPLTGEAAELARVACADCHSNETRWPAYSYVAPMSWLVRNDVEEGREKFNLSDWDEYADDADEAAEEVAEGKMPPDQYTLIHRDAKLTAEERSTLVKAFEALDDSDARPDDDSDRSGSSSGKG